MLLQRGLVGHLFPHIETHDSYKRKPEQSRVRFDCRGHQLHPFPRLWRYFKVGLPCRLRVKSEGVSIPTALHASIRPGVSVATALRSASSRRASSSSSGSSLEVPAWLWRYRGVSHGIHCPLATDLAGGRSPNVVGDHCSGVARKSSTQARRRAPHHTHTTSSLLFFGSVSAC